MEDEQLLIVNELKSILKSRRISYRELSHQSGLSESILKKVFACHETSLGKIIKICKCLNLTLADLFKLIGDRKETVFSFSLEQEEFFAKNLEYYFFFDLIFREKLSLDMASKRLNLNMIKKNKILLALSNFHIIEDLGDGNIKFLVSGGIKFINNGPLLSQILNKSMSFFYQYLLNAPEKERPFDDPFMRFSFSRISSKTYSELLIQMKKMHEEFANRSIRDRKIYSTDELNDVTWLLGVGNVNAMYSAVL